ncbi:MAG: 30S ribosome-binding factor RbfA [Planctomycetota bacterium]|nr:MAG: 30S ribosome-binding factor RbfA [Planctomycetota bacterium]
MANPKTLARLASRIQERAAHCLAHEIKDPRAGFVTITRVEVSSDLSHAKLYYSVLGTEGERSKVEHMLQSASGFIQRQVTGVLSMRRAPRLTWRYDDSIEHQATVDAAIRDAIERDRRINPLAHAEVPEPEPIVDEKLVLQSEINDFLDEQAEEEGDEPPPPARHGGKSH